MLFYLGTTFMYNLRLCSSVSKKLLACALLVNPVFSSFSQEEPIPVEVKNPEQVKKMEEAIKQLRELQADNKKISAEEAHKDGNFIKAIEDFITAIDNYKKVSSSEPRILQKLKSLKPC